MKTRVQFIVVAIAVASILSGCALVEDKTNINYVQAGQSTELAGAEDVRLSFSSSGRRIQFRDRVSTKKNGYGMEMARIVSTNDVVELTQGALQQEFKALGFAVGAGGLAGGVELQQFYSNFKPSFFTGSVGAEVGFALRVKDAAGASLYTQFYSAVGTVDNIMLASGENARAALEKALELAVKEAVNDNALIQVLLSTNSRSVKYAPARGIARRESHMAVVRTVGGGDPRPADGASADLRAWTLPASGCSRSVDPVDRDPWHANRRHWSL